ADDDEDEEDDGNDVVLRHRNRPPSLPTGELTSVIALRNKGGSAEPSTKVRDEPAPAPQPPKRPEPLAAGLSSAPRRLPATAPGGFGHEESRSETLVRESSPRNAVAPREPMREPREPSLRDPPPRSTVPAAKPTDET